MMGNGMPPMMGGGGPGLESATSGVKTKRAVGVRYAWIDLAAKQLVRVDDFVLYTVPVAGIAPVGPGLSGNDIKNMGQPQPAMRDTWYLVRYQYIYVPVQQQAAE
jgi:hypothetical protein